jgi:2-polyprenyl-6-methoxyphenol hydroxylase-like FAD-dependent oxidoreductase
VRIACVGGGPAGLYLALLLKLRDAQHDVTVFERNAPGAARGWGVVLWDELLEKLRRADPESASAIEHASFIWNGQITTEIRGKRAADAEVRGYGIKRQRLLSILTDRAIGAGVRINFNEAILSSSQLTKMDLIVACDGVNSRLRNEVEGVGTGLRVGKNKYIWLGTDKVFQSFLFPFVYTDSGWIWAHAYGVEDNSSTFIVECSADTYIRLGFDVMPAEKCLSVLEELFEPYLDGHHLFATISDTQALQWLSFRTITNERWSGGKIVLMGDAAHTTHFTIGSGTQLAIEDAIALAENLQKHDQLDFALESYGQERRAAILQYQKEAHFSEQWFEDIPRYAGLKPHQFLTLLRMRRSPLMPHLPPQLYYGFYYASHEVPIVRGLGKRVGPTVSGIYSRFTQAGGQS